MHKYRIKLSENDDGLICDKAFYAVEGTYMVLLPVALTLPGFLIDCSSMLCFSSKEQ